MPRTNRKPSVSQTYHVMVRGVNREAIFREKRDYRKFLSILSQIKQDQSFELYAFCLMNNHIHLLIHELQSPLSASMHKINARYASWFNSKYERVGHLFQNRFRSEAIETTSYALNVLRYIHLNPVKAGLVNAPEDFSWSSCQKYYQPCSSRHPLVDTEYLLGFFSPKLEIAIHELKKFTAATPLEKESFLDYLQITKRTDIEIKSEISEIFEAAGINQIAECNPALRTQIFHDIKQIPGASLRQLGRLLNISPTTLWRS